MTKKNLVWLLATFLLVNVCVAQAQQLKKIPTVGRLGASSATAEVARINAFRQGLRDLGYVEGKNIAVEYRHAEGKLERLPHSQPNSCVARSMSLSRAGETPPVPPKKQPLRYLLSWRNLAIRLRMVGLPVLRDRVATSPVSPTLLRS